MNKSPKPWSKITKKELSKIRGVCLDIDETLSTRGKLTAQAYSALWKLKNAGMFVIPITGRPAGWCDHIARFWPVDAVVGENGAFTYYMEGGKRKRITTPGAAKSPAAGIETLKRQVLSEFPKAQWASDQFYREYDLAIDFCEDVAPWPEHEVKRLVKFCEKKGAHAKVSSIHVNAWFGDYDKRRGLEHWLSSGAPGITGKPPRMDELIFIGDSPNDEPMFAAFRCSVGVANLKRFLPGLKNPPTYITRKESGAGFSEMVSALI